MATATTIRRNKRGLLAAFFREHLHQPINSFDLHMKFGTAVRARISELNNDPDCELVIRNHTFCTPSGEVSIYIAAPRHSLFRDTSPTMRHRDDG
jgi:hypothetical protein